MSEKPDEPRKAWSHDEEIFNSDTLGELIDRMDNPQPGDVVYVGDVMDIDVGNLCDSTDVIDTMEARASDLGGEFAEDYPHVTAEARAELDALLAAWITKHCPPTFYSIANVKPYTLTAEDLS